MTKLLANDSPEVAALLNQAGAAATEIDLSDPEVISTDNGWVRFSAPRTVDGMRRLHQHLRDWEPDGAMNVIPRAF